MGKRLWRCLATLLLFWTCQVALASPFRLLSAPDPSQLASAAAGGDSWGPIMTPDGRFVLFASTANNLVPGSNNLFSASQFPLHQNVFLRDRSNGATVLVSANVNGMPANGNSTPTDLSTNGRYALFESSASDLIAGSSNNNINVFMRDLVSGTTFLVSASTNAGFADGPSYGSVMTPDGRYVAFVSESSNLVFGDTNGIVDVFVRDTVLGNTTLASVGAVSPGDSTPPAASLGPLISYDGRFVAFYSTASNLLAGISNSSQIYVRDLFSNVTIWASASADDFLQTLGFFTQATTNVCFNYALSADGKFAVYETIGSQPSTSYQFPPDAILRVNLQTEFTELVNAKIDLHSTLGIVGRATSSVPVGPLEQVRSLDMTPDGRFVAFISSSNSVLVWDAQTGSNTLASVSATNGAFSGACDSPVIDPSGRFVTFFSTGIGLTTNPALGNYHLYQADLLSSTTTMIDLDTDGVGCLMDPGSIPKMSANGRYIAFESAAGNLVPNDLNQRYDVFVRDLTLNSTELISARHASLASISPEGRSALSTTPATRDGRFVAFESDAEDLVSGDTNGFRDVFLRDLLTGSNTLISVDRYGLASGNGLSTEPTISADGRFVAFTTTASNLVAGDTITVQHIVFRDLLTGVTSLVTTNPVGANGILTLANSPQLSSNGRFLIFRTQTQGASPSLYIRNIQSGATAALTPAGLASAVATRDGMLVAFVDNAAEASGLISLWSCDAGSTIYTNVGPTGIMALGVSPDGNTIIYSATSSPAQIFAIDRSSGSTSVIGSGFPASQPGFRFSSDSRFLVYSASPGSNRNSQVFLYDVQLKANALVSASYVSAGPASGSSDSPDISPDGRFVAFRSSANDITVGDGNGVSDVYVFDRITGVRSLVSLSSMGNFSGNGRSLAPSFSPDGQTLFFQSVASDLAQNDFNQAQDIFAVTLFAASIQSLGSSEQGFSLSWPTDPGRNYRVQFKVNLSDADWQNATGAITNLGIRAYFNDFAPGTGHRFYRLLGY